MTTAETTGPDIVVVGSHAPGLFIYVERVPVAGETVMGWDYHEPVDGGKGSNQAIAAARLGGAVCFVGCLGRDRRGDDGERWLQEAGIDTTFVTRSRDQPTIGGFTILDAAGVPAIVAALGANADLSRADVDRALAGSPAARILLTQFEIEPQVALYAARRAREQGMTTIVNPAPASVVEGLAATDILTPNESEAMTLLGLSPARPLPAAELAQRLRDASGAGTVLVTLGERGAVAAEAGVTWRVPAPRVRAVDTTGAGDAFNGALAVALARGWALRRSVEWACQAAALSVTRKGTIPIFPTEAEVAALIARGTT
jgi:ribokinase